MPNWVYNRLPVIGNEYTRRALRGLLDRGRRRLLLRALPPRGPRGDELPCPGWREFYSRL
jgi:hypothetical protein